ncbi:hypothetical protein Q427_22540 [Halomonas sp. BC04]|nr:hypothetical protein Q427_23330 [Halomonas sp. BC04]EWG99869.1 hypothetical protein Q427_22540 [Halomonas sp. BC04]
MQAITLAYERVPMFRSLSGLTLIYYEIRSFGQFHSI